MTASRPSSRSSDIDRSGALEQALALHAMPDGARLLRERPLPDSTLQLIRIAAGDSEALASASASTGEPPARVVEAVVFYIQQMFFNDGTDSYRTLGANPDAPTAAIKEHYRWLMRWLHPDRNPGEQEAAWSERVNRAWKSLSTEQRRSQYDASRPNALTLPQPDRVAASALQTRSFGSEDAPRRVVLSARATRVLPRLVFGMLATTACVVLVASYRASLVAQSDTAAAASLDAGQPKDDNSAQKAAIRDRIAFEERAAAMGTTADDPRAGAQLTRDGDSSSTMPAAAATLQRDFTTAYARGDLKRMLGLFAPDAVSDRGGIASIAADYSTLFAGTTTRELDLDGLQWTVSADRIVGTGPFASVLKNRDEPFARSVRGWIRIEAVPGDGVWKIQRIEQANAP